MSVIKAVRRKMRPLALIFLFIVASCKGPYSTLDPAGDSAKTIAVLFWWMAGAGFFIWLLFIGMVIYSVWVKPGPHDSEKSQFFIIGGGVGLPLLVITISIYFSLLPLPGLLNPAPKGSLTEKVSRTFWTDNEQG